MQIYIRGFLLTILDTMIQPVRLSAYRRLLPEISDTLIQQVRLQAYRRLLPEIHDTLIQEFNLFPQEQMGSLYAPQNRRLLLPG